MDRVLLVVGALAIAGAFAALLGRRTAAPSSNTHHVPSVLDRRDFERPDAPWLVAVFTSSTCDICSAVADKARVLESADVAVQEVEFTADRALHQRYGIDAVPAVVIAGADGATRQSFLGPVNATDLWAAMAEVREPGSTPRACGDHDTH